LDKPAWQAAGPLESARALGGTLVSLLRVRAELVAVELEEEVERRKRMLLLGFVALLFLAPSLLLAALLVVVYFWDTWRLSAIGGVTFLYAAVGAWAFLRFQDAVRNSPTPFGATLEEFRKDLSLLRGHDD
jgi:uncharacterized membrane protein YqjE